MAIPTEGTFIPPLSFLAYVIHAVKKTFRQSVPHFAVVKRISHAERRSRSTSLQHAYPLPVAPSTPSPSSSGAASHRRAVLIAHWIRQSPRIVAEIVCSIGRDISSSPLLWAAAQHHGVSFSALAAKTTLEEVVATSLHHLSKCGVEQQQGIDSSISTQFTILASLLPVRGLFMCSARWVHHLVVADEIQIVRWLRSRQPEKWWVGMGTRILTSAVSGVVENSLVLVLCVRAWFPQGRALADQTQTPVWSVADLTTLVGRQQAVCALGAALVSATIRSYVLPRTTTFLQRVLLWCFEEVEYFAMRRYADVGRHPYYDDVDESLLTNDERAVRNEKREAEQRAAVLRAVGMRSASWIITRVCLVHPLNCLMQLLNSMAVLWALGIASPRQGNRVLLGLAESAGWTSWAYDQSHVELQDFGSVLVETSIHSSSLVEGDGNVVKSLDVLMQRVGSLEPLYRGWQWTLLASVAALHVSTIGRITATTTWSSLLQ
ncbi:Hypothetical protein, putative [Bodo saltans]|uniref:Uncharacterized protein n=1 Tax=Bodo saltans TaxID=75058 RepID=A0A0S4JMW3_BODSA|nr:Hypothetical protein, putative [Bodo saltans]|eukprot:CUG92861.1 Hypothetical protein, putative [Bodo saltans]